LDDVSIGDKETVPNSNEENEGIPLSFHKKILTLLWLSLPFLAMNPLVWNFVSKPRIITTTTNNPFLNLALEEWLWDSSIQQKRQEPMLYLWRNEPSVIIGRHQNPYKECHLQEMEKDKVHLVRRFSGISFLTISYVFQKTLIIILAMQFRRRSSLPRSWKQYLLFYVAQ
jgi:hypothetical protein